MAAGEAYREEKDEAFSCGHHWCKADSVRGEVMEETRRQRPPDVLQPHQHPPQPGCTGQQNPICLQFRRQAFAADTQFGIEACCVRQGKMPVKQQSLCGPHPITLGFGIFQLVYSPIISSSEHKETSEGLTDLSCTDAPSLFWCVTKLNVV